MDKAIGRLLSGLLVAMLSAAAAPAEDFSVHLDEMAEIDASRPMPDYKLDKVLTRSDWDRTFDMPDKTYDVFIRFKAFGDVRLDEAGEQGPSTGKIWPKGHTSRSGLDLAEVKAGWIKDAPDLFIVAWLVDCDGRGNGHDELHAYVILRLRDGRAEALMRGSDSIGIRTTWLSYDNALESPRFSFDRATGCLVEEITRNTEIASRDRQLLSRLTKDENGDDYFVAPIREKVTIRYRYADGGLAPASCRLTYFTQEEDELSDIARFYLGPYATRQALLNANPGLAAKYKETPPGWMIYLPANTEVIVPVPEKQLIDRYCRGVIPPQALPPAP